MLTITELLDAYEDEVKKLPLGHENIQRGRSTYNWKMAVIRELRDLASREERNKLLDPNMPGQELRLHMGEMTAQELRTARAAIEWANSRASTLAEANNVLQSERASIISTHRTQIENLTARAIAAEGKLARLLAQTIPASLDDELAGILVRPLRWVGPDLSGEYYTKNGLVPYKVRPQSGNGFWLTEVGGYYPDENAAFIAAGKHHHALVSSVLEHVEFSPAGHFLATKFADGALSFQAVPIEHADRAHVVELFVKTKKLEAVQQ